MTTLLLTVNSLCKLEMEYHGKFGHNIGRIQHISIMIRIDIFYKAFHLETQTMAPTIPGFQSIKRCIQYLDIKPHKYIFIFIPIMMDKI